jgi:hypothetical protein
VSYIADMCLPCDKKVFGEMKLLKDLCNKVMGKRFFCFQSAQIRLVAFPASCLWYRGLYLEKKQSGCEVSYTPSSIAQIKNAWSCTSTPPVCLHGMILK